jgi:hypothetical protein
MVCTDRISTSAYFEKFPMNDEWFSPNLKDGQVHLTNLGGIMVKYYY